MKTLDRYILGQWLQILALVLAAAVGLLLLQQMYDDFHELLDAHARVVDIVMYYLVRTPGSINVVLPLAVLVSLLYSLGRLHRNNEITVMRAAGLSLFRLTRGIWVVGLLGSGLMGWFNAHVVPWSVEQARRIKESIVFRDAARTGRVDRAGLVTAVAFDNQAQGRLWFINRYSRFAGHAFGVTVSVRDAQRRETARILAREAVYDPARRSWAFFNGTEIQFDPESGQPTRSTAFARQTFPGYDDDPQLMLLIDRNPVDLSFRELGRLIAYLTSVGSPKVTKYALRYYGLLADTLGCLVVIGIAIPFALSGVRVSPVVGVSKSIGLFFVYYFLVSFANLLGARELLTPAAAAGAPYLVMLGAAAVLIGRMK